MRQQGRRRDVRGLVAGLLAFVALPAVAQVADDALPPGRPIPHKPMIASRIGKPYPLVSAVATMPDAAQAAGHHGKVSVSGTVSTTGRFADVRITMSSRSAVLDDAALADARSARFIPARDADGDPLAAPYTITLDYTAAQQSGLYRGEMYRCAQMVKDADWWQVTWPEATAEPDPLYLEARDAFVAFRGGDTAINESRRARLSAEFATFWAKVLTQCRAQHDLPYSDAWRANGITIPLGTPRPRWSAPR